MHHFMNDFGSVVYWIGLVVLALAVLPLLISLTVVAVAGSTLGVKHVLCESVPNAYAKVSAVINAPKNRTYVLTFIIGGILLMISMNMH